MSSTVTLCLTGNVRRGRYHFNAGKRCGQTTSWKEEEFSNKKLNKLEKYSKYLVPNMAVTIIATVH